MLVALETGLRISEADDFAYKQKRFNVIVDALRDVPGVSTRIFVSEGHARELYLDIDWDQDVISLTREQFIQALRDHTPAVEIRLPVFAGGRIQLSATVMDEGEDAIVGEIVRKTLLRFA